MMHKTRERNCSVCIVRTGLFAREALYRVKTLLCTIQKID